MIIVRSVAGETAISEHGAEPQSLRGPDGHEHLWQAGEAWRRHAPILFPIVGRVPHDSITIDGTSYPMGQHGFARDTEWDVVERAEDRATLRMTDSPATRQHFPFGFELSVSYAMDERGLETVYTVRNTGDVRLPFSLGSHPAFRWPLDVGADQRDHVLELDRAEPAPIRRLDHTLVLPDPEPSPFDGATLRLDPALFASDAIVMDEVASHGLRYLAPSGRGLRISWDESFDTLVVWSPPAGAELLCLEPCQGGAAPIGFDGDFRSKPGIRLLQPGTEHRLSYRIEPLAPR